MLQYVAHASFALTLLVTAATAASAQRPPIGLCSETGRLDGFMSAVCDGERALSAGRAADAVALFSHAAESQRLRATNELAWAGLAAAYCRLGDVEAGRRWAARFEDAHRLWLGELACPGSGTPSAQPQPFVRDQMCVEGLASDYEFIRTHSDTTIARAMAARLQGAAQGVAAHCSALPPAAAQVKARSGKPQKKGKRRKTVSGKEASPDRGR